MIDRRPFPTDPRYLIGRDGSVVCAATGRCNRPLPQASGYAKVSIGGRKFWLHRVAALTWLPNPEALPQVAHVNGRRDDNAASNLRWSDQSANERDKLAHGTHARGARHGRARLTDEKVKALRAQPRTAVASMARDLGISSRHAFNVWSGRK